MAVVLKKNLTMVFGRRTSTNPYKTLWGGWPPGEAGIWMHSQKSFQLFKQLDTSAHHTLTKLWSHMFLQHALHCLHIRCYFAEMFSILLFLVLKSIVNALINQEIIISLCLYSACARRCTVCTDYTFLKIRNIFRNS